MDLGACIPTRFHTRDPKGTKKGVSVNIVIYQILQFAVTDYFVNDNILFH
jgi:hypothetical protein